MKAKKLPSGNWRVQIMIDGKRVSVTAPTEDEAVYEAIMLKTGKKEAKNTSPTIGKCIDDYIASKRNILSPTTVDGYERCKKNNLAELCNIHISDITQLDIQKHINKLALTKSPKTISNAHGLLIAVLNVCRPEFQVKTTLPKQQKKIKHLPDVRQVFKAIKGSEIELPCLLAMWCSLRMSEVRGVKKSDIKGDCLTVHSTIVTVNGKHIEKNTTKTIESTRELRLPKYILDLISALPQDQEYITILTGQTISKRLSKLLANNGIEGLSFHGLRHMNASIMVTLGIPDKYAMERGGWSTDHVMKSVYQHTFSKEREAVDDKIDDFFNSIIETL